MKIYYTINNNLEGLFSPDTKIIDAEVINKRVKLTILTDSYNPIIKKKFILDKNNGIYIKELDCFLLEINSINIS